MPKQKKVLLRGSWQTIDIGDIAHTPGFLSLAKDCLPEAEVWLWPCSLDRGVRYLRLHAENLFGFSCRAPAGGTGKGMHRIKLPGGIYCGQPVTVNL